MMHGAGGERTALEPRSISGLLDATFQVYRRNVLAFVVTMAVVTVPVSALNLAVNLITGEPEPARLYRNLIDGVSTGGGRDEYPFLILIDGAIYFVAYGIAHGAAILIASAAVLGQTVSIRAAYREAVGRLGGILWANVLFMLGVGLLALTCIGIPFAVYVALGWSLCMPALLIERRGAIGAIGRSRYLAKGHRWRLFICLALASLLVDIVSSTPWLVFGAVTTIWGELAGYGPILKVASQIGTAFFAALGWTVFGAIGQIATTLLYYDLRVRKEAFDLEHRSAAVAPPPRLNR